MFHYTPDAIIVSKDSQFKTLQDLIDYAKANPGAVTFAGSGTNSANHLALQRFNELAGVTTTYIPFGGTGPSVTALLGGQVMAGMGYSTVAANHADDTRMLAVATEERMALFPDVPTFKELGIDMVSGAYRGIAVPASTPEDTRKELSDIIDRINHDPDFIKRMEEGGFVVTNIGYDQIDAFMAQKKKELSAIAQQMGILKQ
jgi:tripartite-type tricarboxylate transporter receptor subunit TctC